MAQLYQFLASGGQIQPLHAVRGVVGPDGKALNRYDTAPPPAQEGDAIAARLIGSALQQTVTSGTARQLLGDGLGRLESAGKTGTSNDSRDSWYAGYTGDHLAVIWVGNDQNQPTGLYGATGAMRVWSGIFSRLPSKPLDIGDKGIDWKWVVGSNATDAECPGARRFAFVAGFQPGYAPCEVQEQAQEEGSNWRDWFGFGRDQQQAQPPQPQPQQQPQPEEQQ
jgi:penicillin-binding protein 1B